MSGPIPVMSAKEIERALARMGAEVLEASGGASDLVLVGIHTRGVPLAHRLAKVIAAATGTPPPVGILDINLYRDDLSRVAEQPVVRRTEIAVRIDDRPLVLVDDVLFTGRTIRAALDALTDLGRPRRIMLAVLVERDGRELPIRADFVGKTVPTPPHLMVNVFLRETDGRDVVELDVADERP